MNLVLPIIQVIISALLVTAVMLQQRGAGLSSAFGGSGGESYHTKRGFEKILFVSTIVLATLFLLSALVALFI